MDEVYQKFEEIKNEFTSMYFFPSDFVQFFYYYRPFLWNVSKQVSYVLKRPLKVKVESGEFLPSSFLQFEELENHILYFNEEPYSTLRRHYQLGLSLKQLGR